MEILRTPDDLRQATEFWHRNGETVALVPTMGALHEGHLTLVEKGLEVASKVVVSIFVNPKQFAANEDLGRYPRDEDGDVEKLTDAGAHLVYAPDADAMYGDRFATKISVEGPAKAGLEDKFRPHFFDGVATVVTKLFTQSRADFAIFGEKDYQQLMVVKRLAEDLNLGTRVIGVPTKREADGLAMSSRNQFLSKHERHLSGAIYRALAQAAEKISAGADLQVTTRTAARSLGTQGFEVDYFTARNADSLAVPQRAGEPLRILVAARVGKTRLIDNVALEF
jgi:pantoate--beta-alanine ligase